jgi:hypothetical protein
MDIALHKHSANMNILPNPDGVRGKEFAFRGTPTDVVSGVPAVEVREVREVREVARNCEAITTDSQRIHAAFSEL